MHLESLRMEQERIELERTARIEQDRGSIT
jgi:hypothetical protein